jgi:peptide/nickel transport system permease protein
VLALLLVLIFAVSWLAAIGRAGHLGHAILPIVTLSIGGIGILARFSRSAMIEVMGQPYIRTASAKGLKWRDVVWNVACAAERRRADRHHSWASWSAR